MNRPTPISLWDATAEESDYEGTLPADLSVDVAIVGGGFTGLSTALHCAEKGLSAQVLEAKHIGYGGSGRNVGLVNAGIWLPPAEVKAELGAHYGPRFLRRFADGPRSVFDLIEKHQIRCEVTKTGTIHAAHSAKGLADLAARRDEWVAMDEPVELIDADRVREMTGAGIYHGGLLDHRAGTVNPMGYCRGLARAARGAGAEIATGVKVTRLLPEGDLWRVETDQGVVTARNVVLGTNAYTDDLWPGLKNVFAMIHFFQFATKPLGEAAAHILPDRQGLWDTAPVMFGFRRDAAGRLLIGSMGRVHGGTDSGLTQRWVRKRLRAVFPEIGDAPFEEAWHGQIAMTADHIPKIHQLAPGLWTGIGYNGRGITTGTIFGEAIAGLLTGMDPQDLPLPLKDPKAEPAKALKERFYDLAFVSNQMFRSIF